MSKFENDAQELLKYIGGTANIRAVTHCVTRMRFVLIDSSVADISKIESIPSVKGTFNQSGQFQVIIGNEVANFYNDFIKISNIEKNDQETIKNNDSKQNHVQRIVAILGEIFAPLIPALICGGLILGFRNIISEINFFNNGTQSLTDIYPFLASFDHFLWLISEAIFPLLPVGIVWSITKKMETTQILGIILGLTLVIPQSISSLELGVVQISITDYQGQIVTAMLAGFMLVFIEKSFNKIIPNAIKMIIVPFCSLILTVFVTYVILGPIGLIIESIIANVVNSAFTSNLAIIIAAIIGFIYVPFVMTGLHHLTIIIDTILTTTFGGTILWPMIALSNIAQASSVLAMFVLQRNDKNARKINAPACISCYLGVSEPALFDVNIKHHFPLISGMIGSAIAATISVGFGIQAFSIGIGGLPAIISIKPEFWGYYLLAVAVAIGIPFILTYVSGRKKLATPAKSNKEKDFICPMAGNLIPLSKVEDQVFSQGLMGDGFAVELKNGEIIAPFSGEVIMTFPTKHAYGLKRDDGLEVLIHIGMDTVHLNGKGFESFVNQGDFIKQGQTIAKVDLEYVLSQKKSVVSPVVFTSGEHIECNEQFVQLKQENIFKWKG